MTTGLVAIIAKTKRLFHHTNYEKTILHCRCVSSLTEHTHISYLLVWCTWDKFSGNYKSEYFTTSTAKVILQTFFLKASIKSLFFVGNACTTYLLLLLWWYHAAAFNGKLRSNKYSLEKKCYAPRATPKQLAHYNYKEHHQNRLSFDINYIPAQNYRKLSLDSANWKCNVRKTTMPKMQTKQ